NGHADDEDEDGLLPFDPLYPPLPWEADGYDGDYDESAGFTLPSLPHTLETKIAPAPFDAEPAAVRSIRLQELEPPAKSGQWKHKDSKTATAETPTADLEEGEVPDEEG
ncbi:hypothetical protein HK405_011352, partial [Cladochytrium tenue]